MKKIGNLLAAVVAALISQAEEVVIAPATGVTLAVCQFKGNIYNIPSDEMELHIKLESASIARGGAAPQIDNIRVEDDQGNVYHIGNILRQYGETDKFFDIWFPINPDDVDNLDYQIKIVADLKGGNFVCGDRITATLMFEYRWFGYPYKLREYRGGEPVTVLTVLPFIDSVIVGKGVTGDFSVINAKLWPGLCFRLYQQNQGAWQYVMSFLAEPNSVNTTLVVPSLVAGQKGQFLLRWQQPPRGRS